MGPRTDSKCCSRPVIVMGPVRLPMLRRVQIVSWVPVRPPIADASTATLWLHTLVLAP
ncbi:unnamed protein product [Staurois parvus]|uniref:Uncharacterized protein n=1 Tax=Staurois parvus TaxID=386267 RepID=A0ABN9BYN9_9NEOB|nr:unnamed protein product [Staurois parvus]